MGNLFSRAWVAVFGEPVPPSTVLVPPLFKPLGVSARSTPTKSGFVTAFRPPVLKQLMQDYLVHTGGVTGASPLLRLFSEVVVKNAHPHMRLLVPPPVTHFRQTAAHAARQP